jgi:hypothetical protein
LSDIHGLTDWITRGSHPRNASAIDLLSEPDQLKKTFMAHLF